MVSMYRSLFSLHEYKATKLTSYNTLPKTDLLKKILRMQNMIRLAFNVTKLRDQASSVTNQPLTQHRHQLLCPDTMTLNDTQRAPIPRSYLQITCQCCGIHVWN